MTLEQFSAKKPVVKGRTSVSAEVYGLFNKKGHFVPKVYPKNQDIEHALLNKLNESFMFRALEP